MIKNKITKVALSLLVTLSLMFSFNVMYVSSETKPTITITHLEVSNDSSGWGQVEVVGYIANSTDNTAGAHQVTFLLTDTDDVTNNLTGDHIAYIDQKATGNNASFRFQFQLADKFTMVGTKLYLRMNSDDNTDLYKTEVAIPIGAECNIFNLANNTVWYGKDAYSLESINLTATNVANSIITHGNKIYYKYNYKWYDLLDEDATSSAFFMNENNACSDSQVAQQICTGCSKCDGSKYYYGQYVSNILPK